MRETVWVVGNFASSFFTLRRRRPGPSVVTSEAARRPPHLNAPILGPGLPRESVFWGRVGRLVALLTLAACHGSQPTPQATSTPTSLEAAAIEAGIVADPANTDPTGLYTRDRDRICIVPSATAFRIGIDVDYGDTYYCSGRGAATRAGETLHVELANAPGCNFDARFEGDRILLPGRLPDACQKACSPRASLTGLAVERMSDSPSEAGALRDRRGRMLCAADK